MLNYATLGTVSGFKYEMWQLFSESAGDPKELEKELDLKTNLILPSKNSELFVFKTRLLANGKKLNYFILYRGADEIEGSRLGSFYGSAIIILNKEVDSISAIISILRVLADTLKDNCINQNRFIGNLSLADNEIQNKTEIIRKAFDNLTEPSIFTLSQEKNQRFVLINENKKTLNEGASVIYNAYIKKYAVADIYFSVNKELAQNIQNKNQLSIYYYPTETTEQNKNNNQVKFEQTVKSQATFESELSSYVSDKRPIRTRKDVISKKNELPPRKSNFQFFPIRTRTLVIINLLLSAITLILVLKDNKHDVQPVKNPLSQEPAKIDKIGETVTTRQQPVFGQLPAKNPEENTIPASLTGDPSLYVSTPVYYTEYKIEKKDTYTKIAEKKCVSQGDKKCTDKQKKAYANEIKKFNNSKKNLKEGDNLKLPPPPPLQ